MSSLVNPVLDAFSGPISDPGLGMDPMSQMMSMFGNVLNASQGGGDFGGGMPFQDMSQPSQNPYGALSQPSPTQGGNALASLPSNQSSAAVGTPQMQQMAMLMDLQRLGQQYGPKPLQEGNPYA
jgi:hypothetical protein